MEVVCSEDVLVVLCDNILLDLLDDCGWLFDIFSFKVVDSVLVF